MFNRPTLLLWLAAALFLHVFLIACHQKTAETLPPQYQQKGDFVRSLPYFNPDSCVLLIRRDVPPRWQGAAYENLFLDGPEDSPLELGFKHLDYYEKHFPADTAREFAQLWRGRLLIHLGKLDSAAVFLQSAYESSRQNGRFLIASDAQTFMSNIFYKKGKTAEAIRAQLTIYQMLEPLDSTQNHRKYVAISNLAASYSQSNQHREALKWQQKALSMAIENKHDPQLFGEEADALYRLGILYFRLKHLDSALLCQQQCLELQRKDPSKTEKSDILLQFGKIYLEKNDCPTALGYFHAAKRALNPSSPKSSPDLLQIEMAKCYQCLGRIDSAEILLRAVLPIVKNQPTQLSAANTLFSEILAQKGNFREAYDALNTSRKIREKFFTPEKAAEMVSVKNELELERAELKAANLEVEHRMARQRNLITALFFTLGLALLIGLFLRQRSKRRILEQEKQILEKDKTLLEREKELAQAYAQIQTQALEKSQNELQLTQNELEQTARLLELKNQLIEELQMHQRHRASDADGGNNATPHAADAAADLRRMKILTDEDWQRFQQRYEQVFPNFLKRLKFEFPKMTAAETRLFLLYKLQFSNQEIAEALGISVESVWRSRHRLGKKIGLSDTGSLEEVVSQFN